MIHIKGKTGILGVIGNPIEHSLSPVFQNYMIKKAGLDYVYIPLKINLDGISDFMKSLRVVENLKGINVTIPFKEEVINYVDILSEEAKKIGAINTISVENGKFYGYNTDVCGIIYTLKMKLKINELKDCLIVLLGAGGASKSAIWSIHGMGARKIFVVNRTIDRFKKLSLWTKKVLNLDIEFFEWENLKKLFKTLNPDLIINSTPLGLKGEKIYLDFQNGKKNLKVFDMTYGNENNYLANQSKKYSFLYCDGLPMLVAQGTESFRIWTGVLFDNKEIYTYIKNRLKIWQRF